MGGRSITNAYSGLITSLNQKLSVEHKTPPTQISYYAMLCPYVGGLGSFSFIFLLQICSTSNSLEISVI
jgi:hypothetical protein